MIKRASVVICALLIGLTACQSPQTENELYLPWVELEELFHDVQMEGVFPDSKTFVDYTPKRTPSEIVADY